MQEGALVKLFRNFSFNSLALEKYDGEADFEEMLSNCYGRFVLVGDRHYRDTPLSNVKGATQLKDLTRLVGGILEKAPTEEQYILRNPFTSKERQFFYSDLLSLFVAEKVEEQD